MNGDYPHIYFCIAVAVKAGLGPQDDLQAAPAEPPLRLRKTMLQLLRSEEALLTAGDPGRQEGEKVGIFSDMII